MAFPAFIPYVAITLKPLHFVEEKNATIYGAILKIHEQGRKVNLLTVGDEVGSDVSDALKNITATIATADEASEAANSIVDQWMLREMSSLTKTISNIRDTDSPWDTLDHLQSKLFEISSEKVGQFTPLSDSYDALVKSVKEGTVRDPYWGLPIFEGVLGGVDKGELVIISARPGAGKSSLFNNRIITCVKQKRPVVVWSGEMSSIATLKRFICGYMDQSSETFDPEAPYAIQALGDLDRFAMYSFGAMTWEDLKPQIIHYNLTTGCRDFLIDRLELLYMKGRMTEDERIKRICGEMRLLATKYDLRIDMAVQMRKSSEDSAAPSLADVLGGTAITNDATKVILINRPESRRLTTFSDGYPATGKGELIVAKNTFGATVDSYRLDYNKTRQIWTESEDRPF